ncbi:DUF1684 domain-containing protein [Hymenobacter cellulosilyticus]|uniref:DUF1684 domain-containing protein n=1 Tax=Hymenobacter cellulosilyticus TaxID=2932248 RepID=A0A8T9QCT6_9BACT|nr:DUF1684 domain-containing protein [Hymenobacter cellulosilyticus]UOQ74201.1 DUF1684 domain-containing protein [Hymenobacter cellulosilyticus]
MRINPKLLIGLGLLVVFAYFLQDLVLGHDQYATGIQKARTEKNNSFRRMKDSPLNAEQRDHFDSLQYFAPDKAFRVTAQLERFARPDTIAMPLTDGKADKYLRWGKALFTLNEQPQQLVLFLKVNDENPELFVPFTDKTNGFDTYGGGRYLDVALPAEQDKEVVLDFNGAYNPFCAYNNEYACPVPPADNRLAIPIPAGEKSFPEEDHTGHSH